MLTISASQACPIYKEQVFPIGMRRETLHINILLPSSGHKAIRKGYTARFIATTWNRNHQVGLVVRDYYVNKNILPLATANAQFHQQLVFNF